MNYKKMYYELFNQIADIISQLQDIQKNAEELYLQNNFEEIDFQNKNNSL